jgi:hypothetical protein
MRIIALFMVLGMAACGAASGNCPCRASRDPQADLAAPGEPIGAAALAGNSKDDAEDAEAVAVEIAEEEDAAGDLPPATPSEAESNSAQSTESKPESGEAPNSGEAGAGEDTGGGGDSEEGGGEGGDESGVDDSSDRGHGDGHIERDVTVDPR